MHRHRKRLGLRPVTVIVSEQEIDFLLARDYELTRRDDRSIGRAVSAFLSDSVLEGGVTNEEATQKVREASKTGNAAVARQYTRRCGSRYFVRQADWLEKRFPDAKLRDVEGLVKLVDRATIKAHDWSLTP